MKTAIAMREDKMAEYIERETLLRSIADDVAPFNVAMVFRHIHNAPTADVAPVVHGRWEREPASYWRWTPSGAVAVTRTTYRCGLCGRGTAVKSNYCPNCGAKMDGGNS